LHPRPVVAAGLTAVTLLALPAAASAVSPKVRQLGRQPAPAKPYFDSRVAARHAAAPSAAKFSGRSAAQRSAVRSLKSRLGTQGVVSIDPLTGTVRAVQKLDGTLTAASSDSRSAIAMRFIRANATALGLSSSAVSSLQLARNVSSHGIANLRYRQSVNGIPDFDNGLRVNIDRQGRILNVTGAPLNDLSLASTTPKLSAGAAMAAFQRNVGVARPMRVKSRGTGARQMTTYTNGDFARLVIFGAASGPKLAWHLTYQAKSTAYYDAVVDANSGAVLYRQNLTKFDGATTDIAPNYPGADRDPKTVGTFDKSTKNATIAPNLVTRGWLPAASDDLTGPFVHTFSDVNDDNAKNTGEEIPPSNGTNDFLYPMRGPGGAGSSFPAPVWDGVDTDGDPTDLEDGFANACDYSGTEDPNLDDPTTPTVHEWPDPEGTTVDCAWDPTDPGSWDINRAQDGVQAFYLANVYHDHLANSSIGFDAADGNFAGDDPVEQNTDDGADTADPGNDGGPDGDHINNANMSTPPDGISPRMQMYLFATNPSGTFTFRDINGGDDAGTVWHEYTHGLSNRLVTNDDGSGALSTAHAGAMGEAWSDWYALDFLHRADSNPTVSNTAGPLEADDPALPDVDIGTSSDAVYTATRFQPIDCRVGENTIRTNGNPWCVGGIDTPFGGYTFGDFGHVAGAPEVHSDGEIWMETLWDLRRALIADTSQATGSDTAEEIVTEAMRLSPPEPSFLDMRNAILAADQGLNNGDNQDLIWSVFATRGMGFFASVNDSSDTAPFENFDTPPADNAPKGTVSGTVVDDTGHPVSGMPVGMGGQNTQLKPPATTTPALGALTDAQGHYSFQAPAHAYHALVFTPTKGFDGAIVNDVTVPANGTVTRNATVRRDWAGTKGGAVVLKDDTKYDNTGAGFGCGLDQLADQSLGTGNSAFNPTSADPENPHLGPPTSVIQLPKTITVASFGLDPSNTCGDDPTAATKDYTIETSSDGVHWTLALKSSFTPDDLHRLNIRTPTGGTTNVRFVRLRLLSPQGAEPGDSGVDFIDFSEIEVYGGSALTGTLTATPPASTVGQTVTFNAAFTDPDGDTINNYRWDFDGNGTVDQTTAGSSTTFAYPAAGTFHPTVTASDTRGVTGSAATTETVTGTTPPPKKHKPKIGKLPRTGKHGKVSFKVTCQSRCKLVAVETMSKALKRKLHLDSRTAAKLSRTLKARKSARKITLTVSKKVRRAAKRHHVKTLRVKLSVSAKTTGLKTVRKHRNVVKVRL
jgi:extracellular elastinolytic metalloproteinase